MVKTLLAQGSESKIITARSKKEYFFPFISIELLSINDLIVNQFELKQTDKSSLLTVSPNLHPYHPSLHINKVIYIDSLLT